MYIPPPYKQRECDEEHAAHRKELVHPEIGRDDAAEERPCESADLLRGATKDELTAHASALAEALKARPSVPVIPTQGATPSVSDADSARRAFAQELFGSK